MVTTAAITEVVVAVVAATNWIGRRANWIGGCDDGGGGHDELDRRPRDGGGGCEELDRRPHRYHGSVRHGDTWQPL